MRQLAGREEALKALMAAVTGAVLEHTDGPNEDIVDAARSLRTSSVSSPR